MQYLRRQNFNTTNIVDQSLFQSADGNIELNPTHRVVINGDLVLNGNAPSPEVSNVMYVTVDGNDANSGFGEGADQAKRTVKAAVEAAQEGTTIFVRSGEYYEDNPIRLPPKVSIIGDNLRRTILKPLNKPITYEVYSYQRIKGIVTIVTKTPHELLLHDRVRVEFSTTSELDSALDLNDGDANIIEVPDNTSFKYKDFGEDLPLTVIPTLRFPDNGSSTATTVNDGNLLRARIPTFQIGIESFLSKTYGDVWTSLNDDQKEKCKRDVKYIAEAVSFDVQYGGNHQSVIAGEAYYSFGVLQISGAEKTATIGAYEKLKEVMQTIAPDSTVAIENLIDDIISIIDTGISPSKTYPSINGETLEKQNSFTALQNAKATIATNVTNYISATYPSLFYTVATCQRDIQLIIDSICYDFITGSNFTSTVAGQAYYRIQSQVVINEQLTETLDAINFTKTQALALIDPTLTAEVTESFDNVYDILENGIAAAPKNTSGEIIKGFDFFLVNSQSYIAQLVIRSFPAPGYCVNIDKDAIVDTSPYIQNCSNISGPFLRNGEEWLPFITEQPDLTGTMVTGPRPLRDDEIDPRQLHIYGVNVRGSGGGMLIDGDRYSTESPIKSMVGDAFTQITQGGIGFHITNFGYMQLVSCFAVFCDRAFYTTKGGYLSISNSVIDFGNYGFTADGYYPIPYATGKVITDYYSSAGSVTVNDLGQGYTSAPSVVFESPTVPGGVAATGTAFIDIFKGQVVAISVDTPGFGYTFEPSITIGPPLTETLTWTPSAAVTTSDIVKYDRYFYEVTVAGNLGTSAPDDRLIPQVNGTATLLRVGTTATATVNLAKNNRITLNNISEKPQIASIMFLGDDPIGYYITSTDNLNLGFAYNETKCRRDIDYISQAVIADAMFNTSFRSTYAGLAYLRSYSSKVTSLQKAQTIDGITKAKEYILQLPEILANATLTTRINNNFTEIVNIIQNGVSAASQPTFTQLAGQTAGFYEAGQILLANKTFIENELIEFISNTQRGFEYDNAKCARDIGIIIDAVLADIVLNTNYLSKYAGISYLRSYSSEVTASQKEQTIDGINRAKNIILKIINNYDFEEILKDKFAIIEKIIFDEKSTSAPDTAYESPVGVSNGVIISARQLEINRSFIVQEIIAWIKDNLDTESIINYNEKLCRRDVEYIIDALIFDTLYGGNTAIRNISSSYYDPAGNSVISTQIIEHVTVFNRLKTVVSNIIQNNTAWTKSSTNSLTQDTSLGVGTESTAVQFKIDTISSVIQFGLAQLPIEITPTYSNGTLYQYYNDERSRVLQDKTNIQTEVIEYLNSTYNANFISNYSETTCRRDIRYIVDALVYDLTYGGNTQTTNAALAYSEGSVIIGEIEQTKATYQYWKSILPYILQNISVPNAYATGQNTSNSVGFPVPLDYPSTIAQNLLQIVIDTIDFGTGYVPEPVTESKFELVSTAFNDARIAIISKIYDIQEFVISYLNLTYGGSVDVDVFPGILSVDANTELRLHNVSTISTGGTALEYVGSGVTYNALPFFGGEPIPAQERNEINNGKCFTVTNDQVGNFRVGALFGVNALTGAVTIDANQLDLQGLESIGPFIRNSIPVGVELKEVSNNTNLIASNGLVDIFTVPTQFAVSEYVENRYLNKVNTYGGTPQSVESNVNFVRDIQVQGTITTPNANEIAIGTPELGILDGAVKMVETTSLTDGVSQLNQILTLLVPLPPPNFPNSQNLTINGTTSRIMFTASGSQTLNGTGITAPSDGTIVRVIRGNTFSTSTIADTGPGTKGLITVNRNGSVAVTKTLTYGNTTQIISTVITGTTAVGSNVVKFTQPPVGVLFPGYLILTGSSGSFGGLSNNSYYYITAVTATTLSLSNYNAVTGAIGSPFSATSIATGSLSFTSVSDNGTYTSNNTSLVVGDNVAFPTDTPGFHETIDLSVSGTSVPPGWNTVQVIHAEAGSTTIGSNVSNIGLWYYDNSPTVAPSFASQTFAIGTSSLTYSSTIPHYNSSTTYNIGFTLTWNAGQTGHSSTSTTILGTGAVGPWTTAGNKTYANLGYSILPTTTTVTAGSGPNATTFTVNVVSGFGAWTTTTTVPVYSADNSYTTATTSLPALGAIILYKTGTTSSTSFLDETNIFFNNAVGGSTAGATRVINPDAGTANQDTPAFTAGSALFNSQTGTLYSTDAIVVGTGTGVNSLKHDLTNYSAGYLPAGPNLSSRIATNSQYFTFRFTRTGVSKFSITYTTSTGVAAIYCAMPGTGGNSGTTSTLNKWLDLSIDNSLPNGCALGGNLNSSATGTRTYNCSFGILSSTNATNNEIWVRIKLNQGQSITSLYLGASTI